MKPEFRKPILIRQGIALVGALGTDLCDVEKQELAADKAHFVVKE